MRSSCRNIGGMTIRYMKSMPLRSSNRVAIRYFSKIQVKELDDPADSPSTTTLIFGLDGTLLNTSDTLQRAMKMLLKEQGIETPIEREASSAATGESFKNLVRDTFAVQRDEAKAFQSAKFIAEQTSRLGDLFRDISREGTSITVQPDVHETLRLLIEEGHLLIVCSNFPQKIADELLEKFELRRYFALIVGGDLIPVCKPDPGHLIYAVECSGREISGALLIGSTVIDIKAAKAASIPVIAMPRDSAMKEELMKFHPEMFIEKISEIPDGMEQLMENSMY